jgi:carbamoylphosphate synthase large subunit
VPTPKVTPIRTEEQMIRQLKLIGFPAVLKTDGSSGGLGVAIVESTFQAKQAFKRLSQPPSVALTLKRLIIDGDANLVLPAIRRIRPHVTIQRFIRGKRANVAAACWNGTVLANVCVEVLASNKPTSSSTVVRVITNPQMSRAAERIAGVLKLTGLCGMDFIIDAKNRAHLIDFNPRATQTSHLVSSERKNVLRALASKLTGEPFIEDRQDPHRGPVVLFPHGFVCDPASRYARFHDKDLPPHFPEFIQFGLDYRRETNRVLAKAIRYVGERWQTMVRGTGGGRRSPVAPRRRT